MAESTVYPEDGGIEDALLVAAVGVLASRGPRSIVVAPSEASSIWRLHGRPDRLHRTSDGLLLGHGSRQHMCERHPDFRDAARRITMAVLAAQGGCPAVFAWQVAEELRPQVAERFCQGGAGAWTERMRGRCGDVEALNEVWCRPASSETYQTTDQVPLPCAHGFAALAGPAEPTTHETPASPHKETTHAVA